MSLFTPIGKFAVKYAPQILLITGFTSGAGAIVSSVFSTKRVIDHVVVEKERRAEKQGVGVSEIKLTKKEVFKLGWKDFLVPVGMAVISGVCIGGAFRIEHGRALTFAALGAAAEGRLAAIEQTIEEQFGKEKRKAIEAAASQKQVETQSFKPVMNNETGNGRFKIYDGAFGIETIGNSDKITLAIRECDHRLQLAREQGDEDVKVSVADLWENLGAHSWDIDSRYKAMRNLVWISGETDHIGVKVDPILDKNSEPAYVLSYNEGWLKPKWDPMYSF